MTELWLDAWALAAERGQETLTTDLLLVALARQPGVAGEVLRSLGASEDALLHAIPPARAQSGRPAAFIATSPAVEQARGRAEGLALGAGLPLDPTDVLVALAYDDSGMHASVLRFVGVDRGEIVERLRSLGVRTPPVAPPLDMPSKSVSFSLTEDEARLVIDELVARTTSGDRELIGSSGRSRWGYGRDAADPGRVRIHVEPDIPIDDIVAGILGFTDEKGG
jgi:hypothetical protein